MNWTIHFAGTEHWEPFSQPTGEEADQLDIHPWILESVRDLLVVTGSPEDEWVEVLLAWLEPNEQAGWVRTVSGALTSTDVVLEIQRSAGVLNVWGDGGIVWSADDLSRVERRLAHIPLVTGSITGMTEQGGPVLVVSAR